MKLGSNPNFSNVKVIFHTKVGIFSFFSHPPLIPSLLYFLPSDEHKNKTCRKAVSIDFHSNFFFN